MLPSLRTLVRRTRLVSGLLFAAAVAPLAVPASASAACANPATSTPFGVFGDTSSYFLAPSGSFEAGTGWALAGGAKYVAGNESWKVHGSADAKSMQLPVSAGTSSATSNLFCVDMQTPSIRFFFRSDSFDVNSWGYLSVEAHYYDSSTGADLGSMYLATVDRHDGSWATSAPIQLVVSGPLNGGNRPTASARLIFTAHGAGAGTFKIDDVYVDPWHCC